MDISPEGPLKQTLRKSPCVGATTAQIELGFLRANKAISCAPVLVLPQPRPAKINQIGKYLLGPSCLGLAVFNQSV
tara:strand:+ start:93 stop:320 length:228 start_codon:yes stop_codon:yes gene_type:complete